MLVFKQQLPTNADRADFTLSLTAFERSRTRYRFRTDDGQSILLRLSRGVVLKDGDLLQAETGEILRIIAKPESVLTVRATDNLSLLKAAYHLGNRHVSLEITSNYLRLTFDPVLEKMLEKLGLEIEQETAPFQPEIGAYHHH